MTDEQLYERWLKMTPEQRSDWWGRLTQAERRDTNRRIRNGAKLVNLRRKAMESWPSPPRRAASPITSLMGQLSPEERKQLAQEFGDDPEIRSDHD